MTPTSESPTDKQDKGILDDLPNDHQLDPDGTGSISSSTEEDSSIIEEEVIEDDDEEDDDYDDNDHDNDNDEEVIIYEEETISDDEGWDEDLLREYWERYHEEKDIFGDGSVLFDTELMQKLIKERESKKVEGSHDEQCPIVLMLNTKMVLALGKFMKAKHRVSQKLVVRQADGALKVKRKTKKTKSSDGKKTKSKTSEEEATDVTTTTKKNKKKSKTKKSMKETTSKDSTGGETKNLDGSDEIKKVKKLKSKKKEICDPSNVADGSIAGGREKIPKSPKKTHKSPSTKKKHIVDSTCSDE